MSLDAKIAHLGFIQAVITRMGSNSFLLKGWSLTVVAALFALSGKDVDRRFVLLSFFPVIFFWLLDAYFLRQEKLYRKLYEAVAAERIPADSFSLNTASFSDEVPAPLRLALSKTLLGFHGPILAVVLIATGFLWHG